MTRWAAPWALVRRAWSAATRPETFFARHPDPEGPGPALAAAAASGLLGALTAAVMLVRLTGSTAPLPVLLFVPAAALPYLALITFVGGLLLLRPTALEERAWTLVAWSWSPAGVLGLALLPAGVALPGPTLVAFAVMLPVWHLWVVRGGLRAWAPERAGPAWLLYVGVVFVLPVAVAAGLLSLLAQGA